MNLVHEQVEHLTPEQVAEHAKCLYNDELKVHEQVDNLTPKQVAEHAKFLL